MKLSTKLSSLALIVVAVIAPVSSASASTTVQVIPEGSDVVQVQGATQLELGKTYTFQTMSGSKTATVTNFVSGYYYLNSAIFGMLDGGAITTATEVPSYSPLSIFDTVKEFLTSRLLPAISLLVALGISVKLSIRAVKKYSK